MGNDKKAKKGHYNAQYQKTKDNLEIQEILDKKNKQLKDFTTMWQIEKLYLGYNPLEI